MSSVRFKYNYKPVLDKIPYISFAVIAVFGLVSISMLIVTDVASFQPKAAAFVAGYIRDNDGINNKNSNNTDDVTIITSPIYLWLYKYVFHIDSTFDYKDRHIFSKLHRVVPEKVIMMVDKFFENYEGLEKNIEFIRTRSGPLSATNVIDNNVHTRWTSDGVGSWIESGLDTDRVICSIDVAWYKGNERSYFFMISASGDDTTFTNVFSGKSNGTTLASETYYFKNLTAKHLKITVNGNTANNFASMSEINIYGFSPENKIQFCENLEIINVKAGYNATTITDIKLPDEEKKSLTLVSTKTLATFDGTPDDYENHYPYNSLWHSKGGSRVDVRVNK